jgi:hypothetical protein
MLSIEQTIREISARIYMSAENEKANHADPLMESIKLLEESKEFRRQTKTALEELRKAITHSEEERFKREKDRRK